MESFKKTFEQFSKIFADLSPSQRLTFVLVLALVLGGMGFVWYRGATPAEQALLAGKQFSADELKSAQEALRASNYTDFRVDGGKIYVPAARVTQFEAALVQNGGLPNQFSNELESLYKNLGPFVSNQQRMEMVEVAKASFLCRTFGAIPEIEKASIVSTPARERGLFGGQKTTATLTVTPRRGREISSKLMMALRHAVATGFNMSPDHVTVLDTSNPNPFRQLSADDPYQSDYLERKKQIEQSYQKTIEQALQHIPGTIVAVNVELENVKRSREQTLVNTKPLALRTIETEETDETQGTRAGTEPGANANTPARVPGATSSTEGMRKMRKSNNVGESIPGDVKFQEREYEPLSPRLVQATVSLPEDYFKTVAIQQGADAKDAAKLAGKVKEIRDRVLLEVTETVSTLIPRPLPPLTVADMVKVSGHDRVVTSEAAPTVTPMDQAAEYAMQYAGPLALGVFALWALMALNRSVTRPAPPAGAPASLAAAMAAPDTASGTESVEGEGEAAPAAAKKPPKPREPSQRDSLQDSVRDNPEVAAAILSRWVRPSAN